ncbi:MAG: hypothetical protein CVV27_09695 [Candidatus Melainabacteria bacterium HGW-Melainabacteria-1]|nr:MAG: hypothetical protein CVV27_09695 [Candidatus Melainabacteria bacterium HGW-Melainabacteria-1]
MKSIRITLATSLLLISACSPQSLPGRTNADTPFPQTLADEAIPPTSKPRGLDITSSLDVSASLAANTVTFQISLRSPDLKTKALDQATISHFKLEVRDAAGNLWRPAGIDANGLLPLGAGVKLAIPGLPIDRLLFVTITPYTDDNPATPLGGTAIQAVFKLGANATIPVSFRTTPTAAVLWALLQSDPRRVAAIDIAELQAYIDSLTGYSGPGSYAHHPLLLDTAAIATALKTLNVSQLTPANPAYRQAGARLTIHVSGLATDDRASLSLSDPSSTIRAPIVNGDVVIEHIKLDGATTWNLELNSDYKLDPTAKNPVPISFTDSDMEHTLNVVYASTAAASITGQQVNDLSGNVAYREIDKITLTGSNFLSAKSLTIRETGGSDRILTRGAYGTSSFEVVNDATIRFRLPDTLLDHSVNDTNDASFILRNTFNGGSDSNPSSSLNLVQNVLVDDTASGANTGKSWADAYPDLQLAFAEAESGDEIWIAAGSYKPTTNTSDRNATFQLKHNVSVYGGFAGLETANSTEQALGGSENNTRTGRDSRSADLTDHVTILSGDMDGTVDNYTDSDADISNGFGYTGMSGNSYHVVTGVAGAAGFNATRLDGVTIQGGYAYSPENLKQVGGGLFVYGRHNLHLTNTRFRYNGAQRQGGGMYSLAADPDGTGLSLENVSYSGNFSVEGGGLYLQECRKGQIKDSEFNANYATYAGGGLNSYYHASITVRDTGFSGNYAAYNGGGVSNNIQSSLSFTGSEFRGNVSREGGGISNYNISGSPVSFIDTHFIGNTALSGGGAMSNSLVESLQITRSDFLDNTASSAGAVYNAQSGVTLMEVNFRGNRANTGYGGGMHNSESSVSVFGASFNENHAEMYGGGLYNHLSAIYLADVTIASNSSGQGGGMFNRYATPSLSRVGFRQNSASYAGGGMYNENTSPNLTDVSFEQNRAENDIEWVDAYGGGMYNYDSYAPTSPTNPVLTRVVFRSNSADYGGGMYSRQAWPRLNKVAFVDNTALHSGGGSYQLDGELDLVNSVFAGNRATLGTGGGLYLDSANPSQGFRLSYASFSQNSAPSGGGIYVNKDPNLALQLYNLLFWQSPHDSVLGQDFNILEGQGNQDVGNSLGADPYVASCDPDGADGSFFTADDGLRLSNLQLTLINSGFNFVISGAESDMAGVLRDDTTPEPGAYEDSFAPSGSCNN